MRWQTIVKCVAVFLVMMVLWPNLIHEPLHWVALKAQGSSGIIHFDWHLPAHPATERTAPVAGIAGGLFFLLLPSVVSIILMVWLLVRRTGWFDMTLSMYLGFDLIINVWKYQLPFSDWRFFVVMDGGWIFSAVIAGTVMVLLAANVVQEWENVNKGD